MLVADVLRFPEFSHEAKGARMKAIFLCLWELYRSSPDTAANERLIADAVYSGIGDEDDSIVRRAVSRLRRFLDRIATERLNGHSLRVRIPIRQYKLEFYRQVLVDGRRPVEWFWSSYFNASIPVGVVLFEPKSSDIVLPNELPSKIMQRFADTFQRELCEVGVSDLQGEGGYIHEPPSYRQFSSVESRFVIAEPHGMCLGSYPEDVDPEYDREVWRRKSLRTSNTLLTPLAASLPAISYAKLTRFTNPEPPHQQITLLDSEWEFPLQKLIEFLTLDEFLLSIWGHPRLSEHKTGSAPRKFQVLFSATRGLVGESGEVLQGSPEVRAVTLGPHHIYLGTPGFPWPRVETRAL